MVVYWLKHNLKQNNITYEGEHCDLILVTPDVRTPTVVGHLFITNKPLTRTPLTSLAVRNIYLFSLALPVVYINNYICGKSRIRCVIREETHQRQDKIATRTSGDDMNNVSVLVPASQ